ncbi:hypothetical protein QTI05_24175 [Variovorax sp. J22R193]|uniref:hypothetical protein n=1 Tax=Variovorax fucosicus TaxID=3053517 RepID=UPI002575ACBF|nr:hypothetical protein [Variovorax sp. J22R193]MDM0042157.1 hypothetical protein [Variovorax sp. J22R193]
MADNVPITAGSGTSIATDDVSGDQYQRVKITDGTADSANHLTVNASGEALVKVNAALPAGTNNIGDVDVLSLPALPTGTNAIGTVTTVGAAASGASVSGNPVLNGARAATANPTAVTDGQAIALMTDKVGRLVTVPMHSRALMGKQATTITSSTSATTVVSAIVSTFTDITSFTVTNSSSTATLVTLTDGTTAMIFSLAAGPGAGFTKEFSTPLYATTANTAWTLQCGTSVASIYCNIVYAKNT